MASTTLDKIKDAELRKLAEAPHVENVSILIAVDLPSRQMMVKRKGDVPSVVPDFITEKGSDDDTAMQVRAVKAFLEDLVGTEPVWLPAARCFVADVSTGQLSAVAAHSNVKAIWPNQTFKAFDT